MAEAAEAAPKAGGSTFGFLGHKLFGKVPVWVVAVAAVGGYYWYTRYGPGKSSAAAGGVTGTDAAGNTGVIDPSTGYVYGSAEDSAALAAQQGGTEGPQGPPGPPGPPGQPPPVPRPKPKPKPKPKRKPKPKPKPGGGGGSWQVGGQPHFGPVAGSRRPPTGAAPRTTATFLPAASGNRNEEWGGAAVNNLVSQGVPPDQASTAIQAHLNGQPLSPAMAANRDLAVDSIGPPPEVIAPAQVKAPMTAGSA